MQTENQTKRPILQAEWVYFVRVANDTEPTIQRI